MAPLCKYTELLSITAFCFSLCSQDLNPNPKTKSPDVCSDLTFHLPSRQYGPSRGWGKPTGRGWVLSAGWVLELLSVGWVLELLSIGWVLEFLIEEGVEFNVGSA